MLSAARAFDTYCPISDLQVRYPGWAIQLADDLPRKAREVFLPDLGIVLLDRAMYDRDPERVTAHVLAHIDLHEIDGTFSAAEEDEAEMLAAIRLDRPGSRAA